MAAEQYKFDDNAQQALLDMIKGQVGKYDSELQQYSSARAALKGKWEGDEADQYESIFSRFEEGANGVRNVVAEVHNAAAEAAEENQKMRREMARALSRG